MVKLVIVAIHGVGNPEPDYYDKFERKLQKSLRKSNIDAQDYIFRGIHYSKIFEKEADKISAMTEKLNWKGLRRFISHYLGYALAYQAGVISASRIDFYKLVHDRIDRELDDLESEEGISKDTPILFVAHSLGAYIVSNYIWDKQKLHQNNTKLNEMGSLCGLITIGSNIPILTLGFDYDKLLPITLPGYGIEDNEQIKWINVIDKNDPLSVPMEGFFSDGNENQNRTKEKIVDIEMNVGNLLVQRTPISHTKYWNDSKFIDLLKDRILDLIKVFT